MERLPVGQRDKYRILDLKAMPWFPHDIKTPLQYHMFRTPHYQVEYEEALSPAEKASYVRPTPVFPFFHNYGAYQPVRYNTIAEQMIWEETPGNLAKINSNGTMVTEMRHPTMRPGGMKVGVRSNRASVAMAGVNKGYGNFDQRRDYHRQKVAPYYALRNVLRKKYGDKGRLPLKEWILLRELARKNPHRPWSSGDMGPSLRTGKMKPGPGTGSTRVRSPSGTGLNKGKAGVTNIGGVSPLVMRLRSGTRKGARPANFGPRKSSIQTNAAADGTYFGSIGASNNVGGAKHAGQVTRQLSAGGGTVYDRHMLGKSAGVATSAREHNANAARSRRIESLYGSSAWGSRPGYDTGATSHNLIGLPIDAYASASNRGQTSNPVFNFDHLGLAVSPGGVLYDNIAPVATTDRLTLADLG